MDYLITIGESLIKNKHKLANEIKELYYAENPSHAQGQGLSEEESDRYTVEFIHKIGQSLVEEHQNDLKSMVQWGKQFGKISVESGIPADRTMRALPYLRKVLFEFIRSHFRNSSATFDDYFKVADTVNPFIDQTVYAFTQAYVEYNAETFRQAKSELMELSVPVVPLTKEVAILPIIGTIDTYRSKEMLDQSLNRGRELELSYLIVDLSGVHMIDTAIAHNLFQLNDALRVIGVTAIFSGLRPELAQTIVNLGITFDQMKVVRSLDQALKMTGLVIEVNE
ncbi:hypothetical protein CR194_00490 [Salipaludibacillus keqinensis]|uniref:STAS domain-containing protein n=1 Tax=Salipaludibacillus keqinensis TaxID=2045207 RepID=A0A323TWV7_9BACI|nr:STAS domain-containing protein [Salipaludibacillus keqinensis]PYZ94055.1 hypothetical protein CR194_00490 [Salipaludibacillus keqinensis]